MGFLKFKLHYPVLIILFKLFKISGKLIPLSFIPILGSGIGKLAYLLLKSKRKLIYENLKVSFPEWNSQKLKKCTYENFRHYGITFLELFKIEKLLKNVEIDGIENFKDRPSILITGHIGNWELMAQALGKNQIPLFALAKKSYLNIFTEFLINIRKKANIETILRAEKESPKLLLKAIKENKVLGFLIDQETKVESVFIEFFGRQALTPIGPVELALKKNLPLIFGYLIRKRYFKYYLKIEKIDKSSLNKVEILTLLNKKIENVIRKHPTQWVWVHNRWKSQPLH